MADPGRDLSDLSVLVRTNSGKWRRRLLQLEAGSCSLRLVCPDTFHLEAEVRRDACLSVRSEAGARQAVVRWCPRNERLVRELRRLELEFSSDPDQAAFRAFIQEAGFVSAAPRRVLVFINPVSGRGRARQIWAEVAAILDQTDTTFDTVVTERAGQAQEMVEQLDLALYDGVVTVSGDGGLHELLNGLYSRRVREGDQVMARTQLGIVPGGSGHGVHCSLLHHHGEKFSSELLYSALSLARHRDYSHDIIECQTRDRSFASIFGVAWGIIPEVDLGSEFLRFLGPNRGWVVAVWKWLFPVFQTGTVHYLPHTEHSDEVQLPGLDEPVPDTWKTVQGPFFNVYACKQPWLDYNLFFCPDAKPDDGKLWLVIMNDNWSHYWGAYWMLNADRSSHLECPGTTMVAVSAFRFVPAQPARAVMTVDAERLEGGAVQGAVRRSRVNLMVNT